MSRGLANSRSNYGIGMISIHWIMAMMTVALFILGVYMRGLSYVDPYYHHAPHMHKSFGLIVFILLVVRFIWSVVNPKPDQVPMPAWEALIAVVVHKLFYILLFIVMISGYLIPTADGRPIELFNWFKVPALVSNINGQEDIAGKIHYLIAIMIMALAALHAAAAMKHHFIDKDDVLRRILGIEKKKP